MRVASGINAGAEGAVIGKSVDLAASGGNMRIVEQTNELLQAAAVAVDGVIGGESSRPEVDADAKGSSPGHTSSSSSVSRDKIDEAHCSASVVQSSPEYACNAAACPLVTDYQPDADDPTRCACCKQIFELKQGRAHGRRDRLNAHFATMGVLIPTTSLLSQHAPRCCRGGLKAPWPMLPTKVIAANPAPQARGLLPNT